MNHRAKWLSSAVSSHAGVVGLYCDDVASGHICSLGLSRSEENGWPLLQTCFRLTKIMIIRRLTLGLRKIYNEETSCLAGVTQA